MTIAPGSVTVLIPAAGKGERMGVGQPKALLSVNHRPIFEWAIRPFLQSPLVSSVVILVPPGCHELFHSPDRLSTKSLVAIEGGASRQESVWLGLQHCQKHILRQAREYVVIHDAARAMLSTDLLERIFKALENSPAVTAAVPAVDSLVTTSGDNQIENYLDRKKVWRVQTPQAFQFDLIYDAHQRCASAVTDDASLVLDSSAVTIVPGEDSNFKITTAADLRMAEALLEDKEIL